jgi:hypothetical protein
MRKLVNKEGSGIPAKGLFNPLISSFEGISENVPKTGLPFCTMDFGDGLIGREYTDASNLKNIFPLYLIYDKSANHIMILIFTLRIHRNGSKIE